MCTENCCVKQNEFCLDNENEIRGFLRCMENRGCYNVGLTTLSGSLPHNRHICDTHDMNFGVPCWGDESCEEPCGTKYQGNFACGVACCEKQHEYCHKNAFEKWNYFKCMTVRGCGNKYLACSENGKKDLNTAINIMIYTLFLIPLGLLPSYFQLTGLTSGIVATTCGVLFLAQTFSLMKDNSRKSALKIMFGSFIYLPIINPKNTYGNHLNIGNISKGYFVFV